MENIFYEKQRSLQAFKKLVNYVEVLKKDPVFISKLRWFRKYYVDISTLAPLPKNGIDFPSDKKSHLANSIRYAHRLNKKGDDYFDFSNFNDKKFAFEKEYGLDIFGEAFDYLLFYNSVEPMQKMGYSAFVDVLDLANLMVPIWGIDDKTWREMLLNEICSTKPIAICIHPYMSERDVIDFVKKTYKSSIEPMQKKYRNEDIKLKDVRKKSKTKQSRNEFIYDNRDLPIKELSRLVNKTFSKTFDYTYIQTIIRQEIEKRK